MNSSQDISQNDVTFSSLPSYGQYDGNEEPSFLNSQLPLFEDAGILNKSAGETIAELTKVWMDERNAPELLPYEHSLVEPLILAIESQAERIMEDMETNVQNKFESMIYQTEIERVKFVLKSYLRVRLFKIEKYTLHILRQPNLKELLSSQEIEYARRYEDLIQGHNHDSFLYLLPRSQHKQDEISVDMNMVVQPNLDAAVFCRVLSTLGHIDVGKEDSVLFEVGDTFILRYSDVREHLKEKKVRLI